MLCSMQTRVIWDHDLTNSIVCEWSGVSQTPLCPLLLLLEALYNIAGSECRFGDECLGGRMAATANTDYQDQKDQNVGHTKRALPGCLDCHWLAW
jgi:hypothetical protein